MQIEEFKFIYDDLKQQIKQIPPLQNLMRLTQKSIKKLQCINLYSISDKRDFDLQLEEEQIMQQIIDLYSDIQTVKQNTDENLIDQVSQKMDKIKNKNIETFDLLNKQDELLSEEIELAQYCIEQEHHQNQIKEEDEFDDQYMKQSNNGNQNNPQHKINSLKKQIDQISNKIAKINGGRGKWFLSDHTNFIKIYNKCGGNDKKIIEEGVKILGMKNTEIMDHLQIYENYLQFQKQKKIISQQYKQIKLLQQMEENYKKERQQKLINQKNRQKKQKMSQQNEKKREQIQKFKQKRHQQKLKIIQQQQRKQRQKIIRIPLPPQKKKQIMERNQKYISEKQNNFKKAQQKSGNIKATQTGINRNLSRQRQGSKSKGNTKKISQDKTVDKNNPKIQ